MSCFYAIDEVGKHPLFTLFGGWGRQCTRTRKKMAQLRGGHWRDGGGWEDAFVSAGATASALAPPCTSASCVPLWLPGFKLCFLCYSFEGAFVQ